MTIAAGFRKALVAGPGNVLVEIDFSAIEAVLTGWFIGDPNYIRLAKLGVHTYLTSHMVNKPANLAWGNAKLKEFFKEIKKAHPKEYDKAKRCVHGTNYGLTPWGMANNYPEIFPSPGPAKTLQNLYFAVCPGLLPWQTTIRNLAAKQGFLGGDTHPFGFKHYFWNVYTYDARTGAWGFGDDAKRCVAFFPQSTAYGVLAEACLTMMSPDNSYYVGDLGPGGKTPIRALIHDSVLAEVPEAHKEAFTSRATLAMEAPVKQLPCLDSWGIGEYLSFGTEAKTGPNWGEMTT